MNARMAADGFGVLLGVAFASSLAPAMVDSIWSPATACYRPN